MDEIPPAVEEVKEEVTVVEEVEMISEIKEEVILFSIRAIKEAFEQNIVVEEEIKTFIQELMKTKNGLFYCLDKTIYDESGNLILNSLDDFSAISSLFIVLYGSQYERSNKAKILDLCSKTLKIVLNILAKEYPNLSAIEKMIGLAVDLIKLNKDLKKSKKSCLDFIFTLKKSN